MIINNLKYKTGDIRTIVERLGFIVAYTKRSDGVNPAVLHMTKTVTVEFYKRPNRLRVIKESNGIYYRSPYLRDTNDLVTYLLRANLKTTKQRFNLTQVTQIEGEVRGRLEDVYTFISDDKQSGVQLRWHAMVPQVIMILRLHGINPDSLSALNAAFVEAASVNDYKFMMLEY
jgi:hypothetical protein